MSGIKVGQIGLGYWGPKLLRNLVSAIGAENVVACDMNIERVGAASREYPSVGVALNVDDVFNNDEVDAVIIATPLATHTPLVRAALNAGKHVLVEKPLTSSPEEARELAALADAQRRVLMTGHTFLFSPRVEHLVTMMGDGSLGSIHYATSSRLNLGLHRTDANVIWDLASHDFSVLFHVLGEQPESIQTMARSVVLDNVPETAFMNLQFPSGTIASVSVSWRAPRKVRHLALVGQKTMAVYDDAEAEEPIKVYDRGVVVPDNASFGDNQLTYRYGDTTAPNVPTSEPLANEIAHFLACIQTGAPCRSDGQFAIQVVDALAAADESWRRGGVPVEVARPLSL